MTIDLSIWFLCMSFVNVYQFVCMSTSFPFGFECGIHCLIILVPDHCLSFYLIMHVRVIYKSLLAW